MNIGRFTIKVEPNASIIVAVILITIGLMFAPEIKNEELFKLGFTALISWGAGYAMGSKNTDSSPAS